MRIHNPTITGSLALSGSGLTINDVGTLSGSATSTGSFGKLITKNADIQDSAGNTLIGYTPGDISQDESIGLKIGDADGVNTNSRLEFDLVDAEVTFNELKLKIPDTIEHLGDTDTTITFANNEIQFKAGTTVGSQDLFHLKGSKISGSSISTGSFGNVTVGTAGGGSAKLQSTANDQESINVLFDASNNANNRIRLNSSNLARTNDIEFYSVGTFNHALGIVDSDVGDAGVMFLGGEITGQYAGIYISGSASAQRKVGIGETSPDGLLHIKGSTPNIIFEDTSGGSNSAILKFKKTSASEADDDALGEIDFRGLNDADEEILYSYIVANSTDVSDGTEDGRLGFYVMNNGARPKLLELEGTKISGSSTSTGSFGALSMVMVGQLVTTIKFM